MMIFVHVEMCGVNTSPKVMVGRPFVRTNAFTAVSGEAGISGVGGHQHVQSLITML
jgi:hypothetical protein